MKFIGIANQNAYFSKKLMYNSKSKIYDILFEVIFEFLKLKIIIKIKTD
jgi:hypothetical protein